MKKSAYGKPILIKENTTEVLERIENVDELTIQNLVFDYPDCLPISEIDESYNPLIPICKELRTPVGPLDVLMATPNGDLAIIETKLWRNPEARRKVVAQILDYANELSKWSYEDLQREINRNLNKKRNTLFELTQNINNEYSISESDFVDTVSRNLFRGKFLLLIVGDGIKEGAVSITEFLSNSAHMNFAFGMVELSIYKYLNDKIVLPRTIAKTTEIHKINIELPDGMLISQVNNVKTNQAQEPVQNNPDLDKRRLFFTKFWDEFISELDLDDPGQALPNPSRHQNIFIYPANNKYSWISAYFSQSTKRVGVYFKCYNDQNGLEIAEKLHQYKNEIMEELGDEVIYSWDSSLVDGFAVRLHLEDVYDENNRELIKDFFKKWINSFVNTIRPRLKN